MQKLIIDLGVDLSPEELARVQHKVQEIVDDAYAEAVRKRQARRARLYRKLVQSLGHDLKPRPAET